MPDQSSSPQQPDQPHPQAGPDATRSFETQQLETQQYDDTLPYLPAQSGAAPVERGGSAESVTRADEVATPVAPTAPTAAAPSGSETPSAPVTPAPASPAAASRASYPPPAPSASSAPSVHSPQWAPAASGATSAGTASAGTASAGTASAGTTSAGSTSGAVPPPPPPFERPGERPVDQRADQPLSIGHFTASSHPTGGHPAGHPTGYLGAHPAGPRPTRNRSKAAGLAAAGVFGMVVALGVGGAAGWALGQQDADQALADGGASGVVPDSGNSAPLAPEDVPGSTPTWPGDLEDGRNGSQGQTGTQTTATDEQEVGVVLVETRLTNGGGAGTGFVIDEDGTIVTNYHVVDGSTEIQVTVASTGETYAASVVGHNETADIAVLELEGDPDLTPIALDDDGVDVGESVTTIGNSNGQGYLSAASGQITALEESITTNDELTGASNDLSGLLVNDVYAVSGDSGGPLVDAEGEVVGVTTATTSGGATRSYAVPIDDAIAIVDLIEAGTETSETRIGPSAYLGVSVGNEDNGGAGATIAGTVDGGPADAAGIAEGAVITAIDGDPISDADDLVSTVGDREPGESVTITWNDASGAQQEATITLGESPIA